MRGWNRRRKTRGNGLQPFPRGFEQSSLPPEWAGDLPRNLSPARPLLNVGGWFPTEESGGKLKDSNPGRMIGPMQLEQLFGEVPNYLTSRSRVVVVGVAPKGAFPLGAEIVPSRAAGRFDILVPMTEGWSVHSIPWRVRQLPQAVPFALRLWSEESCIDLSAPGVLILDAPIDLSKRLDFVLSALASVGVTR
jgi:hypothetical protein